MVKCPNCGGAISYSPEKKALWCEHCESVFPLESPKRDIKILRKYTPDFMPEPIENPVRQYMCNACRTIHITDIEKQSKRCPSCGQTDIREINNNMVVPDGIVPFELTKEKAVEIFENWLRKRPFAPNDLRELARNGKVSSVYVPIFNINATNVCHYSGTVKKVHEDSNNTIFSTVYPVHDVETTNIYDYPYCANTAIDSQLVSKIVSVDQTRIVPFSSDYLFGYNGAETNRSVHDAVNALEKEYKRYAEQSVRNMLKSKYDEIVNLNCESNLRNITFNYLYTPVFMNHYTYKGKHYHCYIDGATGKVAGRSPKSAGKIAALVGGILAVLAGIAIAIAIVV